MRRTAVAWRPCNGRRSPQGDTEVAWQQAGNGLHRQDGITERIVSGDPCALGVAMGGPPAVGRGSIPTHPPQRHPLGPCADRLHRHNPEPPSVSSPTLERGVHSTAGRPGRMVIRRQNNSHQSLRAARHRRPAAASTVRMDDAPMGMRQMRVRRTMDRPPCRSAWDHDRYTRFLFPQNRNRHLPFLFHDARVEWGRSATEC